MKNENFFDESSEQSKVKSAIVAKYFATWAQIMMATQDKNPQHGKKIAYLDLFAGPSRYEDGTQSTPLMILEKAIQDDKLRERLVTIFNDKDENNTQSLEKAIAEIPGIESLRNPPVVQNREVGAGMVKAFETYKLIPTLFFVDPWGYKGLSLKLIDTTVKDWGCDCIFFFNYNRINMGLPNVLVDKHMDALFGEERASNLRAKLKPLSPDERELMIVEEVCQAIKDMGREFVLPFGFKNESGARTKHYLIFVSKNFRGYEVMKKVMVSESSVAHDGIASFHYSPATQRQPLLFGLTHSIESLQDTLLVEFAGQTLAMSEIYKRHNVGTPFISKNYKIALANLQDAGLIQSDRQRKGSFGDNVTVTFPRR